MLNFLKQAREKGEEGVIIIYDFDDVYQDTALLIAKVDFYIFDGPFVCPFWQGVSVESDTQVTGGPIHLMLSCTRRNATIP